MIAQTRPQLEIYTDDVECAHGATIGQLDEDQAFYLWARGLTPLAARNLLIHTFACEVLDGVQSDAICTFLERILGSCGWIVGVGTAGPLPTPLQAQSASDPPRCPSALQPGG